MEDVRDPDYQHTLHNHDWEIAPSHEGKHSETETEAEIEELGIIFVRRAAGVIHKFIKKASGV